MNNVNPCPECFVTKVYVLKGDKDRGLDCQSSLFDNLILCIELFARLVLIHPQSDCCYQ